MDQTASSGFPVSQLVVAQVATGPEDASPQLIYLRGIIDPSSGGVRFVPCQEQNVLPLYLRTKRWMKAMLHDEPRNRKYEAAIKHAIANWVETNRQGNMIDDEDTLCKGPVVLDIGSGTGLLAMLAARAGAPVVYGCEMSRPIAHLSRRIIKDNHAKHFPSTNITILDASSTDLSTSPGQTERLSIPHVDVIVCELFDTVSADTTSILVYDTL